MTDKRILLNSNNELVAEDPDTGNREPVPFDAVQVGSEATIQGGNIATDWFDSSIASAIADGNAGIVWVSTVADGETVAVTRGSLVTNTGAGTPSGCNLIIADLSNNVSETTLISGDGSVQDDETGAPLGQYENTSGGSKQIAIMVDNGQFNSGSGDAQQVVAAAVGRVI